MTLGIFVTDLIAIRELDEVFEIEAVMSLDWQDDRTRFDPEEAGVEKKSWLSNFQIDEDADMWLPEVMFDNGMGDRMTELRRLEVSWDGHVHYLEKFNAILKMPMRLHLFPFDTDKLIAILDVFEESVDDLVLVPDPDNIGYDKVGIDLAQWHIEDISIVMKEHQALGKVRESEVLITLEVRRKPGYYIWKVILPLMVIIGLTWVVFWMKGESLSDRMNISFIGILTVVAYQFLLSEVLPKIPYLTFMDCFLFSSFLILALTIPETLLVFKYIGEGKEKRARRIDNIAKWAFPLGYALLIVSTFLFFRLM